jgi:hypothetical protein
MSSRHNPQVNLCGRGQQKMQINRPFQLLMYDELLTNELLNCRVLARVALPPCRQTTEGWWHLTES